MCRLTPFAASLRAAAMRSPQRYNLSVNPASFAQRADDLILINIKYRSFLLPVPKLACSGIAAYIFGAGVIFIINGRKKAAKHYFYNDQSRLVIVNYCFAAYISQYLIIFL